MSILSGKSSTVPMSERPVIESSCANTGSESNYDDSADSEGAQMLSAVENRFFFSLRTYFFWCLFLNLVFNFSEELSNFIDFVTHISVLVYRYPSFYLSGT